MFGFLVEDRMDVDMDGMIGGKIGDGWRLSDLVWLSNLSIIGLFEVEEIDVEEDHVECPWPLPKAPRKIAVLISEIPVDPSGKFHSKDPALIARIFQQGAFLVAWDDTGREIPKPACCGLHKNHGSWGFPWSHPPFNAKTTESFFTYLGEKKEHHIYIYTNHTYTSLGMTSYMTSYTFIIIKHSYTSYTSTSYSTRQQGAVCGSSCSSCTDFHPSNPRGINWDQTPLHPRDAHNVILSHSNKVDTCWY